MLWGSDGMLWGSDGQDNFGISQSLLAIHEFWKHGFLVHSRAQAIGKLCFSLPGLAMTSTNVSDGDVSASELQSMFHCWTSRDNSKATTILVLAVFTGISNFVDQFPETIRAKLPATLAVLSAAKFAVCDSLGRACCGVIELPQRPVRGPMEDHQWIHPQVTAWLMEEHDGTRHMMLAWWLDQKCDVGLSIELSLHAALDLIDGSPSFPQKDCLHRWLQQLMDECLLPRCAFDWPPE